jgi:aryl-alcohol dehydrogenase-like predicted oxidoreductase
MKPRPFGNTGMNVSEIGLGSWQLANPDWGISDTDEALRIVRRSFDAGCNFFDTAPAYNHGKSEELLVQALKSVTLGFGDLKGLCKGIKKLVFRKGEKKCKHENLDSPT